MFRIQKRDWRGKVFKFGELCRFREGKVGWLEEEQVENDRGAEECLESKEEVQNDGVLWRRGGILWCKGGCGIKGVFFFFKDEIFWKFLNDNVNDVVERKRLENQGQGGLKMK